MAESRGVAILVGAGDAIGAAVARRFAKGGYAVCICRRDAAKSQGLVDELKAAGHAFTPSASMPVRKPRFRSCSPTSKAISDRSRSAFSMPDRTSTSRWWIPPKSCSSRLGNWPAMPVSWSAARRRASCSRAAAAPSSLPGRPPAFVAARALRHFRRRSSASARWPRPWRANLGPKNIHVVHLLIDAGVDSEAIHQRMKAAKGIEASDIPPDSLTKTSSIAEAYWFAHQQSRDGWTHELDLRPSVEKW